MARKKKEAAPKNANPSNAYIEGAGLTVEERITETLRKNFMPYAMSAIVSRALPEIDGFKPSHRKLLYTMYKMGLLSGARTKSANVVGQTMRLNPHGERKRIPPAPLCGQQGQLRQGLFPQYGVCRTALHRGAA